MADAGTAELVRFEAGDTDPAGFRHRDHIRLGYEMLRRYPFPEAAHRFACGLKAMTARIGRPEAYHETITVAFLALIAERNAAADHADFPSFAAANRDLLEKSVLARWYPQERLGSAVARATFVLPEPPRCEAQHPRSCAIEAEIREAAMDQGPIDRWHGIVKARRGEAIPALLAEGAVFESPVVHTPQLGREVTAKYLQSALKVLNNESFHYIEEWVGARSAVLEFACEVDGISINGVDIIRWNEHGLITHFKVMVRPLRAINLLHQKMADMLARAK